MKIGDKIEVHNVGSDEWANAEVVQINADGTIKAAVDHKGHEFHGLTLTFDQQHFRLPEKK